MKDSWTDEGFRDTVREKGREMVTKTFTPLFLKNLQLPNRIVFAPFETNYATEEGVPTQKQIDHYARIADGGAGFIIVEATNINPEPRSKATPFGLCLYEDRFIAPLSKLAEKIHSLGAKAALQIVDKTFKATQKKPADATVDEIGRIVEYFVEGTARARSAGFDAVDYHWAHSYTVADFLSKRGNNRRDEYGRTLEGRMRMAVAILKRAREKVGKDFPLICRISGDEFILGGNTTLHGIAISQKFAQEGADMIDVSTAGRIDDGPDSYSRERGSPTLDFPDGCNVHVAEAIRKAAKIPVITVGKIRTPTLIEEILQEEKADLVALGRPLFADPLFPRKAQEGRWEEIISCQCCNTCHRLYLSDKPVECALRMKKK